MHKNIHPYERVFRIAGGTLLASMAFWGPKKKWLLSFLVPVATGAVGTCPMYSALGISTCDKDQKVEEQANEYFPIKSDAEIAAGHPFVGST